MKKSFSKYILFSITWYFFIYLSKILFVCGPLALSSTTALLFSMPIIISLLYFKKIHKIKKLLIFKNKGLIYKILSGGFVGTIICILWGIGSSWFMLMQLQFYNWIDWFALFTTIPIYYSITNYLLEKFKKELQPFILMGETTFCSAVITSAIMVVFSIFLLCFVKIPHYTSLKQAIETEESKIFVHTSSYFITYILYLCNIYNTVQYYFINHIINKPFSIFLFSLGNWSMFFNFCTILSIFFVGKDELKRIFSSEINLDQNPPSISNKKIALYAFITIFITFFIYFPLISIGEQEARQHPEIVNTTKQFIVRAEKIGELLYKPGTIEKIQKLKLELIAKYKEKCRERLQTEMNRSFDKIEANVDKFLDWYYSLPAEYMRIVKLLTGEFENYLIKKFQEFLFAGDPFESFNRDLRQAIEELNQLKLEFQNSSQEILDNNILIPEPGEKIEIIMELSPDEIMNFSPPQEILDLQKRMGLSVVGGGIGGVAAGYAGFKAGSKITAIIAKKIVAKMTEKGIFKVAAKAISKVIGKKIAQSTIGTSIGSVVGSIGGPVGAAIGGAIGGVVTGVTVDKLILELDETMNRDEFKREIISNIEEMREKYLSYLNEWQK